jgi:hypothetical protein
MHSQHREDFKTFPKFALSTSTLTIMPCHTGRPWAPTGLSIGGERSSPSSRASLNSRSPMTRCFLSPPRFHLMTKGQTLLTVHPRILREPANMNLKGCRKRSRRGTEKGVQQYLRAHARVCVCVRAWCVCARVHSPNATKLIQCCMQ